MVLATCLAIALLVGFSLRFRKTPKFMPAGLMAIVSLVCAAVFAIALALWRLARVRRYPKPQALLRRA